VINKVIESPQAALAFIPRGAQVMIVSFGESGLDLTHAAKISVSMLANVPGKPNDNAD
jgi:hypothetical protein